MEYREFMSLTDDEIRQIVTDIFAPEKITCIQKHKRSETITCKIYKKWGSADDEDGILTMADTIELREPFINLCNCISVDFSLQPEAFRKYRQFCLAKGICPWLKDNPYLDEPGEPADIEMHSMLALSTAHLTDSTWKAMSADENFPVVCYKKENLEHFGWFVAVPDPNDWASKIKPETPCDLAECIEFAMQRDADWIMFDGDVAEVKGLPTYN